MAFYQIEETQKIPAQLDAVWDFISSPANLKYITPPQMGFEILNSNITQKMYPGMIISYNVKPFWGIKMKWVTEITHVKEKEYFVDEQRIGPYAMWHHQHKIEQIKNGVIMSDLVTYKPPYGIIGTLANQLLIKNQLIKIFKFRKSAIEEKFGKF